MVNENNTNIPSDNDNETELIKILSEGHYFKKSMNPPPDYDPPIQNPPTNYVKPPQDNPPKK